MANSTQRLAAERSAGVKSGSAALKEPFQHLIQHIKQTDPMLYEALRRLTVAIGDTNISEIIEKVAKPMVVPYHVIGWDIQDSAPANDVADPVIPVVAFNIDSCRIRVKVTDLVNALEIDVKINGNSIFKTRPRVEAGPLSRDVHVFRDFERVTVATNDDVTLNIIHGGDWQFSVYLVEAK